MATGISLNRYRVKKLNNVVKRVWTDIAVEMRATMARGIFAKKEDIVMKLVHTVYNVGAQALGVLNASNTRRNFPKPPAGAKMAPTRPPTSLPFPRPSCHVET